MKRIQEILKKVKFNITNDLSLLVLGLFLIGAVYSFMSVNIHNHFMTFGLDLGFFDEAIWKISRGKFPYSGVGCNWLLEDHFQVILYALAPLYWIWDDVRVILITQSFIMVIAGFPLYLISKKITKSIVFSFSVVFSYLFFIGTQFAILNEFHQIAFAPLFIGLVYYALIKGNIKLYILSIIGLLITKEDLALLVSAVGWGLLFKDRYRKLGLLTGLLGVLFFFFLLYFFMPAISVMGVYDHFDFGQAGYTPVDIVIKVIKDPLFFFRSIVTPTVKVKTFLQSFFTFGILPIFAPLFLLVPLFEDFISRFIYAGPQFTKWGLVNHHAAVSSMLLAIATIFGTVKLINRLKLKKHNFFLFSILIVLTAITSDLIFHGPINSLFKSQFYFEEEWVKDNQDVISRVQPNATVAAQNNLVPHLTHRDSIYRLPYGLNSEYMVVDLHDGPNKYAPLTYLEMKEFVQDLLTTKRYSIVYQKGDAMLLKRNYKTDITKSKYYGDTRYCYYSFEER